MCSQAMVNARQTPILASPRANIAGSQTNRFITASYFPLAPAPGSGPFEKRKTVVEAQAQPSQAPLVAADATAAVNGFASFRPYVSTPPASSNCRKLAILIRAVERKDPIRTQATAHTLNAETSGRRRDSCGYEELMNVAASAGQTVADRGGQVKAAGGWRGEGVCAVRPSGCGETTAVCVADGLIVARPMAATRA